MTRVLPALVAFAGLFVFAWGLDLVITAGQDEEAARGSVGWFLLVGGALIFLAPLSLLLSRRRRN